MKNDLFPETLLVDIADGHTFTTSLKIAEHFHKSHKHVLRDIEQLLADLTIPPLNRPNFGLISGLKFQLAEYLDSRNRPQPMYRLTFADYSLVTMGFTGTKALRWKVDYITAFNQMEAQLRAKTESVAAAYHRKHPTLSTVVSCTEQGLRRAAIGAVASRSVSAVTRTRRLARTLGLLPATH